MFSSTLKITQFVEFYASATRCGDLKTCNECLENPACGWCDDGSDTGLGTCMNGGKRGAIDANTSLVDTMACQTELWYFTSAPSKSSTCVLSWISKCPLKLPHMVEAQLCRLPPVDAYVNALRSTIFCHGILQRANLCFVILVCVVKARVSSHSLSITSSAGFLPLAASLKITHLCWRDVKHQTNKLGLVALHRGESVLSMELQWMAFVR